MKEIAPLPGPQTQALAAPDTIRETLYGGARGGGKTFIGIIWIAEPALDGPHKKDFRGLVIRKNYIDLCDWQDRAMQVYRHFGAKIAGGEIRFPEGAVIRSGHLADLNAYEKYQGHEYHRILLEELTQIPDEIQYLKLISSCRSTIEGLLPRVFATANPGGPGHSWVKARFRCGKHDGKAFLDEQGQRRLFIPARLSDNPYLDQTDYRKTLEGLPAQLRRAWLDGDWDSLTGQFFTEWNPAEHVCEPFTIPPYWRRYCAMDWGYRPDPWVNLWFAVDERGHEYLYREDHGNEMTPEEVARRLVERSDGDQIGLKSADPSMGAKKDGLSSLEKMGAGGWWVTPANNDRENGAMRIREYLRKNRDTGKPWLRVFSTCTKTAEAIPAMLHDEKDPRKYSDHPLDHWVDALRYHLMDRPSRATAPEPTPPENSMEYIMQLNQGE